MSKKQNVNPETEETSRKPTYRTSYSGKNTKRLPTEQ